MQRKNLKGWTPEFERRVLQEQKEQDLELAAADAKQIQESLAQLNDALKDAASESNGLPLSFAEADRQLQEAARNAGLGLPTGPAGTSGQSASSGPTPANWQRSHGQPAVNQPVRGSRTPGTPGGPAGPPPPGAPPFTPSGPPPLPPPLPPSGGGSGGGSSPLPPSGKLTGNFGGYPQYLGYLEKELGGKSSDFHMQPANPVSIGKAAAGDPFAIAEVLKSVVDGVKNGIKDMQAGLGKTASTLGKERVGDVGSSAAGGVEQMAHGARGIFGQYNPLLIAVEKSAGFVKVVFESIETLRKWNDELIKSNVKFAEHSAAMTQVEVSMERFKIEMDQVRGARRAESAMFHAESVQRLERQFAKWEDAWANIKGNVLGSVNNVLTDLLKQVEFIVDWLNRNNKDFGNDGLVARAQRWREEMPWVEDFGLPRNPARPKP